MILCYYNLAIDIIHVAGIVVLNIVYMFISFDVATNACCCCWRSWLVRRVQIVMFLSLKL